MTTPTVPIGPTGPTDPEVERLRAELAELQGRLDRKSEASRSRTRSIFASILAVLAVLAITASLLSIWMFRTLNNTDLFVARVGSIIDDPAVAQAIGDQAAQRLVTGLELEERIKAVLPEQVAVMAGPITTAAQNYLAEATTTLVQSDQFQQAWDLALSTSHELAIDVLSGDSTAAVSTTDGTIVLNLTPVINELVAQGAEFLSNVLGREITAPTLTGDDLETATQALENALGVDLPADFGTITLFESDDLAAAQQWYSTIKIAIWLAPLAALALLGLALVTAKRRLRTFLGIMVGVALLSGFVLLTLSPLQSTIVAAVGDSSLQHAVAASLNTITTSLIDGLTLIVVVGVIAAALLFLLGNSSAARTGRGYVVQTPGLAAKHQGAFLVGSAVAVLILFAIIPGRSLSQLLFGALLYAAIALAVLLAPRYGAEEEPAPEPA